MPELPVNGSNGWKADIRILQRQLGSQKLHFASRGDHFGPVYEPQTKNWLTVWFKNVRFGLHENRGHICASLITPNRILWNINGPRFSEGVTIGLLAKYLFATFNIGD